MLESLAPRTRAGGDGVVSDNGDNPPPSLRSVFCDFDRNILSALNRPTIRSLVRPRRDVFDLDALDLVDFDFTDFDLIDFVDFRGFGVVDEFKYTVISS